MAFTNSRSFIVELRNFFRNIIYIDIETNYFVKYKHSDV